MATVQYKDNALVIHELQKEAGDGGGSEVRPVHGLPSAVRTQFTNIAAYLLTLSGAVTAGRLAVDLASSVVTDISNAASRLLTLANTVTASRVAVDLATTPTANLATLAGVVTANRAAVDLATTPTANLATLAGVVTANRAAVNVDSTTTGKLDTLHTDVALVSTNQAPPSAVFNGVKDVTTAGTRVTLAGSQTLTEGVWIRAKDANTGTIYVGSSTVASSNGHRLLAKDLVFIRIANLTTINIDSSVNGEGVTYLGW